MSKFWPKMGEHLEDAGARQPPNAFQPIEQQKPYDPMDLDTDDVRGSFGTELLLAAYYFRFSCAGFRQSHELCEQRTDFYAHPREYV